MKNGIGELKSKLKREMRVLRKAYASSLEKKDKSLFDEWLCDNYYILEREAKHSAASLDRHTAVSMSKNGLPEIYERCEQLCAGGRVPGQEELVRQLTSPRLKGREAELLPVMLRLALLHFAAQGCGQERGERLLSNAIKSLRTLPDYDFELLTQSLSPVEEILMRDPGGIYTDMDERTKALYRRMLSEKAKKSGVDEEHAAFEAMHKAQQGKTGRERHIGSFIADTKRYKKRGTVLLAVQAILPLFAAAITAYLTNAWYLTVLLWLPYWELMQHLTELFYGRLSKAIPLPSMETKGKVPNNAKTLITVSSLLPGADKAKGIKAHLRELWLSNGLENVKLCLLADLRSAGVPEKPEDKPQLEAAKRIVAELNDEFGGGFVLAVRPREYSKTQGCFEGSERKRGAITQLVREIKGEHSGFSLLFGDTCDLSQTKYIMALDSDTALPLDTVAALVAIAVHPLNTPVIDEERGSVVDGYGILAPSVATAAGACPTAFSKLMAGESGITAYDTVSAEKYQDFFGEGVFAGKGLIDVDAFYALLLNKFPKNRVLSHDIIEGCVLRCGYVSTCQVADGFPTRARSYYDRLERWIRGDWQNAPFIFEKNGFSALSRYKLFDNLRRSITPVILCTVILLSLLFGTKQSAAAAVVCLLAAGGGNLFSAFRTVLSGGTSMLSRLFYSSVMPAALASLLRGAVLIMLLPQTAFVSLCAITRALWRMTVSKKRLLAWTTFAQSDASSSFSGAIVLCLPALVVSALLLVFGGSWLRLCGVIFLSGIPFTLLSGRAKPKKTPQISYFDREKLVSYAAAMWRYFEEQCTAENSFLPADNMQETPVHRTAHRTSPTNIGLMLLCTLAARDFGFIGDAELYGRLDRALCSVENLEKYHGNLLNWYDTRTLRPLFPRYASTVDSGNFLCCITALTQGLVEYKSTYPQLADIIARIEKIRYQTDLSVFYNERRRLFHIGTDLETGELSPSYYDLLMSEARMTGYYAVASREVSKKHWGALGRTLAKSGRYTGLVSWTGTMFEYFMPYIFLPAPEGTLCYEALKFCAWCQKNRTAHAHSKIKVPWGISESGFFSFDRQLNYQYKAHGVQRLGLKRGLSSELVVSPYSTFLVLPLEPDDALKNLKCYEQMGMTGRCGFYEAADFTHSRTNGQSFAVVRSYMAHHVGMSMLCILNALKDNVLQKRFMSDGKMMAGSSLLCEKIPSDAVVFKDIEQRTVPKIRERIEPQKRLINSPSPASPHIKVLSNGEWTTAVCDTGASLSLYRGLCVLRHSEDLLLMPQGVFAFLKTDDFDLPVSAMYGGREAHFSCEFTNNSATHRAEKQNVRLEMNTSVHPQISCEQRVFTIKNMNTSGMLSGSLIIYFEPSLASHRDAQAHPAFSKLFVRDSFDEQNGILTFTRNARGDEHAVCLAAGFTQSIAFSHECSRESMLKCGEGMRSIFDCPCELQGGSGLPDTCAAFSLKIKLPPKSTAEIKLVLAVASSQGEAVNKLLKTRETNGIRQGKGAGELLREGTLEAVIGDTVVPQIIYPTKMQRESANAILQNNLGKGALWQVGISGDYPIVFMRLDNETDASRAVPYIRICDRLRKAGISCELVIGYNEGGEYTTPMQSAIMNTLKKEGIEQVNDAWGVHTVNLMCCSAQTITAIVAAAVYIVPEFEQKAERDTESFENIVAESTAQRTQNSIQSDNNVKLYNFTDGEITIGNYGEKPCIPWSLVLANKSFGTLVSDKSLGFTWAINSHENKLTPWQNDTRTDNTGELLMLKLRGKYYNLLLGSSASFSPSSALWQGKACEVGYDVRVSVPTRGNVKRCELTLRNRSAEKVDLQAIYYLEPVLGADSTNSRFTKLTRRENGIVFTSPYSEISGFGALTADSPVSNVITDRLKFWSGGEARGETEGVSVRPCAAVEVAVSLEAGEEKSIIYYLSWAACEQAATLLPRVVSFDGNNALSRDEIRIKTAELRLDVMINTWLTHQILSSRVFGRAGFYQCGGAWGYRDQLQDVCALMATMPQIAKQHITRCAAVQFEQGDVLHWWHRIPGKNSCIKGVRTRYSDDYLWLPYAVCEYVKITGDTSLLDVKVRYLQGAELSSDEIERYFEPKPTGKSASIFEHCIAAADRAMKTGAHSLALIGGGDWNDGYNRIGIKGTGESVWLTQFLSLVLKKLSLLCEGRDDERARRYNAFSAQLLDAVDKSAWAGDRYIRAYLDDGTPLGIGSAAECATDSLTQSFAVLSGMTDTGRINTALDTAVRELVDGKTGIVKLLSPPFSGKGASVGYITAYPPGIRENGGQYTHAAVWLCMALLEAGRIDEGCRLLKMLNPMEKCADEQGMALYKAEPYAIAADISSNSDCSRRTGWSLYTGAAAWYYRAIIETMLGIKVLGDKIIIRPKINSEILPIIIDIRIKSTHIYAEITSSRPTELIVDEQVAQFVPLDGKRHNVYLK